MNLGFMGMIERLITTDAVDRLQIKIHGKKYEENYELKYNFRFVLIRLKSICNIFQVFKITLSP